MACLIQWVAFTGCLLATGMTAASELQPAVAIEADGRPLDVEHLGHAAPFFGDFDGDGRRDLLVGEFYQGRLCIYLNQGTDAEPKFDRASVFQDGAPEGCIHAS